jgi:4-diphosphocytidyl-2C-methyl-D-erythritol kinase
MDVRGAIYANGTPVQIYDCNGTGAQKWVLNKLSTKVRVDGTNFCLDAGTTAANGVGLKIWQCYDNLPAQQWYYTADNRIALENQGFCADLAEGVLSNANKIQTWRCTDNNNNQVWTL